MCAIDIVHELSVASPLYSVLVLFTPCRMMRASCICKHVIAFGYCARTLHNMSPVCVMIVVRVLFTVQSRRIIGAPPLTCCLRTPQWFHVDAVRARRWHAMSAKPCTGLLRYLLSILYTALTEGHSFGEPNVVFFCLKKCTWKTKKNVPYAIKTRRRKKIHVITIYMQNENEREKVK